MIWCVKFLERVGRAGGYSPLRQPSAFQYAPYAKRAFTVRHYAYVRTPLQKRIRWVEPFGVTVRLMAVTR